MAVLKLYTMILTCALVYGQGDMLEFKGLESVEMVRDDDIFEAKVPLAGPSSVEVASGEDASLFCRVKTPYKFCNFISPKDVTYSLGPQDDYVHDGRISFAESEDPSRVCGIKVGQVQDTDNGEWQCRVIVVRGGVAKEFSGSANITVHSVAREFSGQANVSVDNGTLQPIASVNEERNLNDRDSKKFSLEGVSALDDYATVSPARALPNIPVNYNQITTENLKSNSSESSLASTSYLSEGLSFKPNSVFNPDSAFADIYPSTPSTNNLRITSEEGFSQVNEVAVIPNTKSDESDDVNDFKAFKVSNNLNNYTDNYRGTNAEDYSIDDSHDDYETNLFKTDFSEGHVVVCVSVVIVVFVIIFITAVARSKGMLCFQKQHIEEKFSLNFSAIEKGELSKENEMEDFEYNEEESKRSTLQL